MARLGKRSLSIGPVLGLALFLGACSMLGGKPADPGTKQRVGEGGPMTIGQSDIGLEDLARGLEKKDQFYRPPHKQDQPVVRIGLLLPFSSDNEDVQELARALHDAAQMALFQSGSAELLLVTKDTGGTPQGAQLAANQAIQDGAEILLGPVFAENVYAVAQVALPAAVPMVAFSSDRKVAQPGVYLLSFQAEEEIKRVTEFAIGQGILNFAAIVPNNDYGTLARDTIQRTAFQSGGVVTNVVVFDQEAQDLRPYAKQIAEYDQRAAALAQQVNFLKARSDAESKQELASLKGKETYGDVSFQAVLIPAGGTQLRAVAPLLPYFDVDPRKVRFMGTGLWDDPALWKEPALLGGWFAAPSPEQRENFLKAFDSVFGYRPPRIASLGYDAVMLSAALSRGPTREQRFNDERLTNPSGFAGVDGIFRFLPDGTTERGLAIMQVDKDGKSKVISPAPTRFDTQGFY